MKTQQLDAHRELADRVELIAFRRGPQGEHGGFSVVERLFEAGQLVKRARAGGLAGPQFLEGRRKGRVHGDPLGDPRAAGRLGSRGAERRPDGEVVRAAVVGVKPLDVAGTGQKAVGQWGEVGAGAVDIDFGFG